MIFGMLEIGSKGYVTCALKSMWKDSAILGPGEVQQVDWKIIGKNLNMSIFQQFPMTMHPQCLEEMDTQSTASHLFRMVAKGVSGPSGIPEDKINNLT